MHARRERSIDESTGEDSRPPSLPAADFSSSSEEVAGSDLFEYLNRDFAANTETAPDGDERTEECAAGAPEEEVEEKTDTNPQWTPEETAEEATVETEPEDEQNVAAEIPDDFDSLYRAFLDGSLDRGRTIEVVERAFDEDRMDEMKRLLAFEPATLGEEIARKYQLARYYLAMERPVSALVALRTVQLGALSKEENKTFLLRIAECYRRLHNFQAAHGIYLRVLSEFPGDPTAEAAARTNYAMYIESAAGAALTLEKLTNL
jgi:hypothetical protein